MGETGPAGTPGETGATGADGAPGPQGERGPSDGFAVTHSAPVNVTGSETTVTSLTLQPGLYLLFVTSEATSSDPGRIRCEIRGTSVPISRNATVDKESTVPLALSGSITLDTEQKLEFVCTAPDAPIDIISTTLSAIAVANLTATDE